MRCSSCEPLLAAYLEASLRPRPARDVTAHLHDCPHCDGLLAELRVIDALLTTARPPGNVGADFTATVVSATPASPPRSPRGVPLWLPVLLYLAIAWALAGVAVMRFGSLAAPLSALGGWEHRAAAAIGAVTRALAPATPAAAAAVTAVLLVDLLLLGAMLYAYRRVRPRLAVYLARGPRP